MRNIAEGSKLFFLGHMTWGYVWTEMSAPKRRKLFIPAVLMLGVMPDIDILLKPFGVIHHTFTHSIFFWLIIFTPFFVISGKKTIPYFVAVVQHIAFGDFLVGTVMIFWPFNQSYFGLNINMGSLVDVALETTGLLLATGITLLNGDLKRLLSVNRSNIFALFPFLALAASMLFLEIDMPIIPLIAYIWSRKLLTTIVLEHLIFTIFLTVSAAQGLRAIIAGSSQKN